MTIGAPFFSKGWFHFRRWSRRIWVRTTLIAVLALAAAWVARLAGPLVPPETATRFGGDALVRILQILASSMLAVTTFSLSIMVQARQSASTQVTPRSYRLLVEDAVTQTVLATFLGAFIFALVSLIVVSTGLYSDGASLVILGFTLLVIGLVVIAMLRWIDHLSGLGSVLATTRLVERTAREALTAWRRHPSLGARPLERPEQVPAAAIPVVADRTGYVCHVDVDRISRAAEARQVGRDEPEAGRREVREDREPPAG